MRMGTEQRTNRISWPARIVLATIAVLLGWFNHELGGWGLPTGVAGVVILLPTLKYQRYWSETWFWTTMLALSTLQVPLVILARPLMDELKFGFNLLFATIDIFFVAVVVNWVRPQEGRAPPTTYSLSHPNSNLPIPIRSSTNSPHYLLGIRKGKGTASAVPIGLQRFLALAPKVLRDCFRLLLRSRSPSLGPESMIKEVGHHARRDEQHSESERTHSEDLLGLATNHRESKQ